VEVIRRLQRVAPRVRPLVLSRFDDADRVFAAVCAGALGYVLKAEAGRTLLGAIADVHGGDAGISPSIARRALELLRRQDVGPDHLDGALTPRETEVLEAAKAHPDWQNKDIARQLKISHRTVANHLSRIYAKLHLFGREDLGLLS
jgi:DNA-binding NarL/FixJ family response regulator